MVPSIDGASVLKVENSIFSTTESSIDGVTIAIHWQVTIFPKNYKKKLIMKNYLWTVTVASSILETLSLRFMFCLSIVYVYKESLNFFYVSSASSEYIISRKL